VPVWLHAGLLVECRQRVELALDRVGDESVLDRGVRMSLYLALGYTMVFTMGHTRPHPGGAGAGYRTCGTPR
jgi:hypothetical protein